MTLVCFAVTDFFKSDTFLAYDLPSLIMVAIFPRIDVTVNGSGSKLGLFFFVCGLVLTELGHLF